MTLHEKQSAFALHAVLLILHAFELRFAVTLGETWRPRDRSTKTSVHPLRLAIDLNLFRAGKYLTRTEEHAELGAWWKRQHSLARWGGDFKKADGNHYSWEHNGNA